VSSNLEKLSQKLSKYHSKSPQNGRTIKNGSAGEKNSRLVDSLLAEQRRKPEIISLITIIKASRIIN
jgi:hypothetical protein